MKATDSHFLAKPDLQNLIEELCRQGYEVVGPTVDQDAIVYAELTSIEQLPRGWTDVQSPGSYRLQRRDDDAWFEFVRGAALMEKVSVPATNDSAHRTSRQTMAGISCQRHRNKKYAFLGIHLRTGGHPSPRIEFSWMVPPQIPSTGNVTKICFLSP